MQQLHFCGGLPRTGSTVLMNILQQNSLVFTTATDPFPHILQEQILIKSRYTEAFQAMCAQQADRAVHGMALGATQGWYEGLTSKPIVISKARQWSGLHHLFPSSKILVTVRDLRDIVESFDRVNERVLALHTFGDDHTLYGSMSEEEKMHYHFREQNAFSSTLRHEIPKYLDLFKHTKDRVKFIRYEDMLRNPQYMLSRIYEFLGLEPFDHDLEVINQSEMFEHDNAYFRERTDHKTQPKFKAWAPPVRKLSERFHTQVIKDHQWFYRSFYPEVLHEQ
jgi:sulfotransferase